MIFFSFISLKNRFTVLTAISLWHHKQHKALFSFGAQTLVSSMCGFFTRSVKIFALQIISVFLKR